MGWLRRRGGQSGEGDDGRDDQTIEAPTQAELDWIETNLGLAAELVRASGVSASGDRLSPPELDQAYSAWFEAWYATPDGERDDPNPFVNAFGIAFGQRLVDDLGLRWAVVTDAHGTEIAVHGQPGDLLVFPPNAVGKRFAAGEVGFFEPLYEAIRGEVERLREQPG